MLEEQTLLQKEVLTFREAAIYLGLSHSYLYRLTSKNILRAYKPNEGKLYFKRIELYNWMLSKQKVVSTDTKKAVSQQSLKTRRN